MILYNHPSYFKSGEINSCRLSPLPTKRNIEYKIAVSKGKLRKHFKKWTLDLDAS